MKEQLDMEKCLKEFHKLLGIDYDGPPRFLGPGFLSDQLYARINHKREELLEYENGVMNRDMQAQADAIIDLMYICAGTLELMGLPLNELFAEVHRSNMTKEKCTPDTKGAKNGIVLKGAKYSPPNILAIIKKATDKHA